MEHRQVRIYIVLHLTRTDEKIKKLVPFRKRRGRRGRSQAMFRNASPERVAWATTPSAALRWLRGVWL